MTTQTTPGTNGTQIAQQESVRDRQKKAVAAMIEFLPSAIDVDRFGAFALAVMRDPNLKDCTEESKMLALADCAKLGLYPDRNLGHVWLVPFKRRVPIKKPGARRPEWVPVNEVKLIPGYQGYIELARRSGKIVDVVTKIVYAQDDWEPPYYKDGRLRWHFKPARPDSSAGAGRWCLIPEGDPMYGRYVFKTWSEIQTIIAENKAAKDRAKAENEYNPPQTIITDLDTGRGAPIAVWCYAPLKDSIMAEPEVMTIDDVLRTWGRSKARYSGPWVDFHVPMMRKSVIRRARKYWPLSTELAALGELDDRLDGIIVEGETRPRLTAGDNRRKAAWTLADLSALDDEDEDDDSPEESAELDDESGDDQPEAHKSSQAGTTGKAVSEGGKTQGGDLSVSAAFRQELALAQDEAAVDALLKKYGSKVSEPGEWDLLNEIADGRKNEIEGEG